VLSRLSLVAEGGPVWALCELMVLINLLLAFFNLLPVPPLDGSRIADGLCPDALRPAWRAFASLGPVGLVAVIVVPLLFGVSLINAPLAHAQLLLDELFRWIRS
jgi:Zn-dependent protease